MSKKIPTLEFQLGYFVGETVWPSLPTLNIDGITSRKVIDVSEEEQKTYEELQTLWFNSIDHKIYDHEKQSVENKMAWMNMRNFHKSMGLKYLPHVFEKYVALIHMKKNFKMDEFKKGFRWSLWDCDLCNYNIDLDKISIENDERGWFTKITLQLDITL
jgi:hypothetical protein